MRHHADFPCRVAAIVVTVSLPPAPAKPPPPPVDQSPLDHLRSDRITISSASLHHSAARYRRRVAFVGRPTTAGATQRGLLGALAPRGRHAPLPVYELQQI